MSTLRLLLVTVLLASTMAASQEQTGLKIVIIEGWEGVNIIQQKTAVKPVVEVRDRNNLPVGGVVVTFAIVKLSTGGGSALFANNASRITATTDATGRATVSELRALSRGGIDIQVRATYQGETVTATMRQTNYMTAKEAANAGRTTNAQNSAQSSGTSSGGGTGAAGSAAGAGGGMSTAAMTGILAGAAAGGVATAVAVKKLTANHAPTVGGITVSPTTGLQASTTFSFSAEAQDTDNDTVTYAWDFGNGSTSNAQAPTQVYTATGSFSVKVTVSDGKLSASTQTSVAVRSVAGVWRSGTVGYSRGTIQFTLTLTQSGTNVSGSLVGTTITCTAQPCPAVTAAASGSVRTAAPRITVTATSAQWGGGVLRFNVDPNTDINSLTGTVADDTGSASVTLTRQSN